MNIPTAPPAPRRLTPLAALLAMLLGCTVLGCTVLGCTALPADETRLSQQAIQSIRVAIESSGGRLEVGTDGQPTAVDLAVGRGSADRAAFAAAMSCVSARKLRVSAGQIPTEDLAQIGALTSLTELLLQDAAIDDRLLCRLTDQLGGLQRLTLRNTSQLTDQGIAEATARIRLTHLALLDLPITGDVLPSLATIPTLLSLDLRMCSHISADKLASLVESPKLKELKLGSYAIDDAALGVVARLPRLEILAVEDASIGASGLAALAGNRSLANRLSVLTLARCPAIDDTALQQLSNFPRLRRLTLRDLSVTGEFLQQLPNRQQLELLSLNQTFLTEAAFDAIAECRQLKRLEVAQNVLTQTAMQRISTLPELEYLNVSECALNDQMIEPLARLANLKTLITTGNPELSKGSLK